MKAKHRRERDERAITAVGFVLVGQNYGVSFWLAVHGNRFASVKCCRTVVFTSATKPCSAASVTVCMSSRFNNISCPAICVERNVQSKFAGVAFVSLCLAATLAA